MATVFRLSLILALAALFMGGASAVYAAQASTISFIRAVRISDTSITMSFVTSEPMVGRIEYITENRSTITLSDTHAERGHLFTIDDLDPEWSYVFTITAITPESLTNNYVVTLSPESVGVLGQGINPSVQIKTPEGELIASVSGATSTPGSINTPSIWWFFLGAVLVFGGWGGYAFVQKRRKPKPLY